MPVYPIHKKKADAIDAVLSNLFNVSIDRIHSPNRQADCIKARFFAWYILSEKYDVTSVAIGETYDRDHTSILHGIERVLTETGWKQEADALFEKYFKDLPRY